MPQIVPVSIRKRPLLEKSLSKQGLNFNLKTKVTGFNHQNQSDAGSRKLQRRSRSFSGDKVLVAVGRRPAIDPEALKVTSNAPTAVVVQVNHQLQTTLPNVYAIGDIVDGPMLAHKAEEEGVAVVETIAGEHAHLDYDLIPGVVYTEPELASVGMNIDQAKEAGRKVRVGSSNFAANGRAKASGMNEGLHKSLPTMKPMKSSASPFLAHAPQT